MLDRLEGSLPLAVLTLHIRQVQGLVMVPGLEPGLEQVMEPGPGLEQVMEPVPEPGLGPEFRHHNRQRPILLLQVSTMG